VRNVLHYRKPSFWISAAAIAAVIFTTVALASNQTHPSEPIKPKKGNLYIGVERYFKEADCTVKLELPEELSGRAFITGSGGGALPPGQPLMT
jgi:hypothetical protein